MKQSQHYLTVLSDTDRSTVLNVVEDHNTATATILLNVSRHNQKRSVKSVSMAMWPAYMKAVDEVLPEAARVHDRYHVSAKLNGAVDETRRHEYKLLGLDDRQAINGTRFLFLRNYTDVEAHQTDSRFMAFAAARRVDQQTAKAWNMK